MSEYLLESGHSGSIANVAYNPCGVNSTSQLLYQEYLDNLFGGENCLGRAVFAARCSIIARYPANDYLYGPAVLWTLLGDPAIRVKHYVASGIEESPKPDDHSRLTTPYSLSFFPNPCDAVVRIGLSPQLQAAGNGPVTIYNATGRLVGSTPVRGSSFVLHTSSFPAGVYVARCAASANCSSVRLVVRH